MVSQVDIMPTVLDYLSIQYDSVAQGNSLRPLIEGDKTKAHNSVYAELSLRYDAKYCAIISEDEKFISKLNTGKKQQFDLK